MIVRLSRRCDILIRIDISNAIVNGEADPYLSITHRNRQP